MLLLLLLIDLNNALLVCVAVVVSLIVGLLCVCVVVGCLRVVFIVWVLLFLCLFGDDHVVVDGCFVLLVSFLFAVVWFVCLC